MVDAFFNRHRPDQVYLAAAKVGGIQANNTYPADFIYSNLQIQNNVIHASWSAGVKKLLFLGSSCIYPKYASQPMQEGALLTGLLEPTNEPYAIAKIAGIKMCESYNRQYGTDFRSVMPTNLYGIGDNYHPENSHVVPALIRRFHEAKISNAPEVLIWGSGVALREFLFVDDLAKACEVVMNQSLDRWRELSDPRTSQINIGSGIEISIKELATQIKQVTGYQGNIIFDESKPDGSLRKLMDSTKVRGLGWKPATKFTDGLLIAYRDFQESM